VGLDYCACTAKAGLPGERLLAVGRGVVRDERAAGNKMQTLDWKGYAIERSGQASVGVRREDVLVTLSGTAAYLFGRSLLQLADHASRADLQVTMHAEEWDVPRLIWRARHDPDPHRREGRPIERHLIDNSRTGVTCYLGSAKSPQRGRFYDKHAESPAQYAVGTARLEVQYRHAPADAIRAECAADRLSENRIRSLVGRWFQTRGVLGAVSFPPGEPLGVPPRERTDYERHRQWLRQIVAPALQRFAADAAPGDLEADLGISQARNLNGS